METKLKKGKYYIGDPYHVFNNSWNDILRATNYFNAQEQKFKGQKIVVSAATREDGFYVDNKGRNYFVDTGLIAILPISLLKVDNEKSENDIRRSSGMHIVNFREDFTVKCFDGKFTFGDIEIEMDQGNLNISCPII